VITLAYVITAPSILVIPDLPDVIKYTQLWLQLLMRYLTTFTTANQ